MTKAFGAILLLALAACSNVPVAQPYPPAAQSACTPNTESSYACQVERYNAIGSK